VVPPGKLTTVANRAFPIVGPQIWNDWPDSMTLAELLAAAGLVVALKGHLPGLGLEGHWPWPESIIQSLTQTHVFTAFFSNYSLCWIASNLPLVNLAVDCVTIGRFKKFWIT